MSFTDVMTAPTYSIDFTDSTVDPTKAPFIIQPGELNTSTSLKLPGAGFSTYGEFVNEDLLHLLENFASPTPPINPTIGQIWYDSTLKRLKFLQGVTGVGTPSVTYTWSSISDNTWFSTTAPTDLTRMWYDMSNPLPQAHTLKIYNTTFGGWQPVVPETVLSQSTAPAYTKTLWFNTSNPDVAKHELYAYNAARSGWFPVVSHDAGMLTGSISDAVLVNSNIGGNAATATLANAALKLATGRVLALNNGAAGSVVFDGSANVTLNVTALNANVLLGTVPLATLGAAGNRAPGYYLDGSNTWVALPYIPNAFTKDEINALLAQKLNINGTAVSSNNVNGMTAQDIINASYARVGTMGKRDLFVSAGAPVASTGVPGDVWFQF